MVQTQPELCRLKVVSCMDKECTPVVSLVLREKSKKSFVVARDVDNKEKELWVVGVLRLCLRFVNVDTKGG